MKKHELIEKVLKLGGPGSGHHGHTGIPGHRGGSASSSSGSIPTIDMSNDPNLDLAKAFHGILFSTGSYDVTPKAVRITNNGQVLDGHVIQRRIKGRYEVSVKGDHYGKPGHRFFSVSSRGKGDLRFESSESDKFLTQRGLDPATDFLSRKI